MQIVIDIDDDIAQDIIDGQNDEPRNIVRAFQATIADAIKNGTPLPKGHSRLIDADTTFTKLNERIHVVDVMMAEHGLYINNEIPLWMWSALIEDTTIIESDKEDKE